MFLIFILLSAISFFILSRYKEKLQINRVATALLSGIISFSLIFTLIFIILVGFTNTIITLLVIAGIAYSVYSFKKNQWENEIDQNLSLHELQENLTKNIKDNDAYVLDEVPYNRAMFFAKDTGIDFSNEISPLVYNAKPHKDEMIFQEYGYLVTTSDLVIVQRKKDNEKKGEYEPKVYRIPFQNIYHYFFITNNTLVIIYIDLKYLVVPVNNIDKNVIENTLETVINLRWNRSADKVLSETSISYAEIEKDYKQFERLNEEYENINRKTATESLNKHVTAASSMGNVTRKRGIIDELNSNQINARFGKGHGHGYVAEQVGNSHDRLKGRMATPEGSTNIKHGPDRIVNGQEIQTKFHSTATRSINSCFENGKALYTTNNGKNMMQIEVPKDQYAKSLELLREKISKGLVPGETNPKNAHKLLKKAPITYEQAQIATTSIFDRNTTIKVNGQEKVVTFGPKLKHSAGQDFLSGASTAIAPGIITGVWIYCNCKWNDLDDREALKHAAFGTVKPIAFSGFTYMIASQLAGSQVGKNLGTTMFNQASKIHNTSGNNLLKRMIPNIKNANQATPYITAGTVHAISLAVVIGPDTIQCLRGRISMQQLVKNTTVAGVGTVGALVGGMSLSFIPVVGSVTGAMVGGTLSTIISKKVLDDFIEDDAVSMLQICKEEFIEVVISANLSEEEFEYVLAETFQAKDFPKKLKLMYASTDPRIFIHSIYSHLINTIYSERELPSEEKILDYINFQNYSIEKIAG